ncbi:MAG: ParB/RepB/Spo0J family partition protein [Acutalibacter sp.]|jgi:ParB family chromosome partitioning protein|uniref:ParB/RepB/Spo0J family partition protein n=1 Tax=Acutalibacter sp. TaxID=1918636 RepID=UPI0021715D64|nr:ParB/RepB/Spo0J family partition protein [Acutalibacter sp.]MCI9226260.1 ParB/RepB/Spo0J family partition protein [Acutalibacter sp.]
MFTRDKLKLTRLPVIKIMPNPSQPRKIFQEDELRSLAQSITENGLLQPVTVRKENGVFYLIAGERRLRACKLAGLMEIPAIISDCEPEDSAVLALLENVQRRDLHMFEQANAIVNLLREWQITQEEAARRLGMSQSYLANKVRLLKLSSDEQSEIIKHKLSERHARALLRIDNIELRQKVLQTVITRGLNVANTEELIADSLKPREPIRKGRRTFVAKDIRLFINTIDHAVDAMKTAGIQAQTEKKETEEYIECVVRIPKQNRVQV